MKHKFHQLGENMQANYLASSLLTRTMVFSYLPKLHNSSCIKLTLYVSKYFIFIYLYGDVHMNTRAHKGQKHWMHLELQELCKIVNTHGLGNEFKSSGRPARAANW